MDKQNCVYILKCKDGTLYTGWTNDIGRRVEMHNSGRGAKYTRGRLPVELVYVEAANNASEAMRRECEIKRMSRARKLVLVGEASKCERAGRRD